ncbi:MAG: putative manganese efflux pump MntP [Firmicutes bacterium ADurb.Bin193]|nr:MAG: putative manganese efflux pump MntP [Firmicutes bacterium ADurb.Bin193]
MGLFDLISIAVGLSMDAFAVSLVNGMTMLKLKARQALVIALFFGFFQGLMPSLGYAAGVGFTKYINAFSHWIALFVLLIIGGKMVYEGIKCRNEKCAIKVFCLKLIAIQAVATSIDALMTGVTFAAGGVSLFTAVLIISPITFVISYAGVYVGKKFGDLFKSNSEILGGVILIIIGLKIFVGHYL